MAVEGNTTILLITEEDGDTLPTQSQSTNIPVIPLYGQTFIGFLILVGNVFVLVVLREGTTMSKVKKHIN